MKHSIKESIIDLIDIDKNLKTLIEGKRVCICGPSVSQIGSKLGKKIDSYDIVCRINMHLPWKDQIDFGKRCDIIFLGTWPVFRNSLRNDLLKYDKKDTRYYQLMKDTKMIYFIDPINSNNFLNFTDKHSDQPHKKSWNSFQNKFNNNKIKYGITNVWLTDLCRNYIKKHYNISKSFKQSISNSGIHAILAILKHNPSELFITGYNFYNWGKGGKIENLYQKNSTDYYNFHYKPNGKYRYKNVIGHVYEPTL